MNKSIFSALYPTSDVKELKSILAEQKKVFLDRGIKVTGIVRAGKNNMGRIYIYKSKPYKTRVVPKTYKKRIKPTVIKNPHVPTPHTDAELKQRLTDALERFTL